MVIAFQDVEDWVHEGPVGRYFEMQKRGANLRSELGGAMATFMSMAYILAVNSRIMAESGGPCEVDPEEVGGIFGEEYTSCIEGIKREYITATAITSMIGCFFMGKSSWNSKRTGLRRREDYYYFFLQAVQTTTFSASSFTLSLMPHLCRI
jgi:hypothetical protein